MLDPIALGPLRPLGTTAIPKDDPAKIKDAARQFEALLIGQMMKSMQGSDGGWLGSEDEASSTAMEYGQEMFAQSLASNGGLGLAGMIARGLEKPQESE